MEEIKEKNPEFIKWFSKINKNLVDSVGEKGANLGELFNKKLPVPEGFVITTKSYSNFLESSKIKESIKPLFEKLNLENYEEIEEACKKAKEFMSKAEFSEELKEEILDSYETLGVNKLEIEKGSAFEILSNASEPIFVSIRGSLPFKNFSNLKVREQNTYLNVKGNDSLLSHVKNCFISLFNPKTVKREFSKGILFEEFKIAVVIQKMVPAEKSGIIYSRNSSGEIIISSIWGLGEGKNIKEISPDKYVLSRELEILNKKIGEKKFMVVRNSSGTLKKIKSSDERKSSQVLNNYEIQRLGDLSEKIESCFQVPQEIEFSIDESGIYILQSKNLNNILEKDKTIISSPENTEEKKFSIEKDNPKKKEVEKRDETIKIEEVDKATKTKLKLVLNSPFLLNEGKKSALKKVGILKIEEIIKQTGKHPFYFLESNSLDEYESLIYNGLKKVTENFNELWIRTSDFLSKEFSNLEGFKNKEENPLLGLHGIRFGLKYPKILEAELRAIKRIVNDTSVGILIPNLILIDELKEVKKLIEKLELKVKIGILIETPASVQIIKDLCAEKIDSIVINTDRLIQYLLAVDKSNPDVKEMVNYLHPAFIYQLEYLIRVSKRNGIETNLFGEPIENEKILEILIQKGIDFIFVEPENAKIISEKVFDIENKLFKGTDLEPRRYEIKKVQEDYLKKDKKLEEKQNKEFNQEKTNPNEENILDEKKIEKDLELIEKEKKEYSSNSSEEKHEELRENPDEKFDENVEFTEDELNKKENKDLLGIF